MKEQIRFPRLSGLTPLMQEYHNTKDPDQLNHIISYIIQTWIISNGTIMGKHYNYIELANFLDINPEEVRNQMKSQMLDSKIFTPESQPEIVNSLISQQITWILEDKMNIDGQVRVLQKSQGDSYKAYITSELNKALALKSSISMNLTSLIKLLTQKDTNIIINNNQQNNTIQNVTIEDVLGIVQEENSKINDSSDIKYIETTYHTEDFPEVNALKQPTEYVNSVEKLPVPPIELLDNKDNHDTRREKEFNLDMELPDPETIIY